MKIINLGSLNIDKTYLVDHIVRPKETIAAVKSYSCSGGKGLNQSVALASAGADVYHAGIVGEDGGFLIQTLKAVGVKTELIKVAKGSSGHALIQLDEKGENSIILDKGTNNNVDETYIDEVLRHFGSGDLLLLQNEISNVNYAIRTAREKGMTIVFNFSPISEACFGYDLDEVNYFIVNEVEASALAGFERQEVEEIEALIEAVKSKYPNSCFVITLGERGAYYVDRQQTCYQRACKVKPVDTTGAGDTFCGYFLAQVVAGKRVEEALHYASAASAVAIGRKGASPSIPTREEVETFIKEGGFYE